jgi:glycosyltransferase involved in cell wall biosynthesis
VTRIAFLLWPETFEDWYDPLGLSREEYLASYDREWSISLATALVSGGVEVHLVHVTRDDALTALQQPSGATVHFVPATAAYRVLRQATWGHRWWQRTQGMWRVAPVASTLSVRLLRTLTALRPDAVVIQDYETLRFDVAAPLLSRAGLRVIGLDTGASARPSNAPWKKWTRNRARWLLAVHEREATRLRELGHRQVAVWPVPVRTDVFMPGERSEARTSLGIPLDRPLVFSATRLHPVKNLPLLVDACMDVGADLVLTGDGPERSTLERKRMAGLRLVGWQTPEQLRDRYAAADVVALSSNQEGQPTAVLEAFACGRAVVATAVGGVPEVVHPGETGWLVPPRNRGALAAALADALRDRDATDQLGLAGRRLVLDNHSAPAVAAAITGWAVGDEL